MLFRSGHQKRRRIEQTSVRCYHRTRRCSAKHPGCSPAQKDTESSQVKSGSRRTPQTTALFRATNIFQKESNLVVHLKCLKTKAISHFSILFSSVLFSFRSVGAPIYDYVDLFQIKIFVIYNKPSYSVSFIVKFQFQKPPPLFFLIIL